jgi:hypothetical protein
MIEDFTHAAPTMARILSRAKEYFKSEYHVTVCKFDAYLAKPAESIGKATLIM